MAMVTRWLIHGSCESLGTLWPSIPRAHSIVMRRSMSGLAMNGEFETKRSQGTEKSGPTAIRTRVAGSASRRDIQATL